MISVFSFVFNFSLSSSSRPSPALFSRLLHLQRPAPALLVFSGLTIFAAIHGTAFFTSQPLANCQPLTLATNQHNLAGALPPNSFFFSGFMWISLSFPRLDFLSTNTPRPLRREANKLNAAVSAVQGCLSACQYSETANTVSPAIAMSR